MQYAILISSRKRMSETFECRRSPYDLTLSGMSYLRLSNIGLISFCSPLIMARIFDNITTTVTAASTALLNEVKSRKFSLAEWIAYLCKVEACVASGKPTQNTLKYAFSRKPTWNLQNSLHSIFPNTRPYWNRCLSRRPYSKTSTASERNKVGHPYILATLLLSVTVIGVKLAISLFDHFSKLQLINAGLYAWNVARGVYPAWARYCCVPLLDLAGQVDSKHASYCSTRFQGQTWIGFTVALYRFDRRPLLPPAPSDRTWSPPQRSVDFNHRIHTRARSLLAGGQWMASISVIVFIFVEFIDSKSYFHQLLFTKKNGLATVYHTHELAFRTHATIAWPNWHAAFIS